MNDEPPPDEEPIGQELRQAMTSTAGASLGAIEAVVARAHRELAVRDVMELGFVHLIRAMLTILSALFRQAHRASSVDQNSR